MNLIRKLELSKYQQLVIKPFFGLKFKIFLQIMEHEDSSTYQVNQTQQSEEGLYLTSVSQTLHRIDDLFHKQMTYNVDSQIYSTQYLTQDMFIGLGCTDGAIRIMSTSKGDVQYVLRNVDHSPVSCLSLNPNSTNIKNSLMATHVDGTLEYWHATSQQLLFSKKYDQFLHCCQISTDGQHYVFAGENGHLKMGALSKGNPTDLQTGNFGSHNNRVFCLKWNPYDTNVFFSGGWDKTVFAWDIRTKTAVSKVYGIYMGGNAIDINNRHELVLGNNTRQIPLRIFDIKANKVRILDWRPVSEDQLHSTTGVLSCFFGQTDEEVVACSPHRQIRLFKNGQCVSRHQNPKQQNKIFSLSKSQSKRVCAIGWNNGVVQFLKY